MASQSKNRQLSGLVDGTPMSQRRKDADFTGSTDPLGKSRSNKRSRQNIIPDLSEDESEEPDEEVDRTPPPAKKPRVTPKTTKKAKVLNEKAPNPKFVPVVARPSAKAVGKQVQRPKQPRVSAPAAAGPSRSSEIDLFDDDEEDFSPVPANTKRQKAASSSKRARRPDKSAPVESPPTQGSIEFYTKAEDEAVGQLEIQNRQFYICGLNRLDYQLPAGVVFTDMVSTNPIFVKALQKTARDFKNWKSVLIGKLDQFVDQWAKEQQRRHLGGNALRSVSEIRNALNESFDINWIPQLFTIFRGVIDWAAVSDVGFQFLQYVSIQMMSVLRMQKIWESTRDPQFAKYTREYVLQTYDGLHLRFKDRLTIQDFPLVAVPVSTRRSQRPFVDPYEDSDGDIDDAFYKDFSQIDRSKLFV